MFEEEWISQPLKDKFEAVVNLFIKCSNFYRMLQNIFKIGENSRVINTATAELRKPASTASVLAEHSGISQQHIGLINIISTQEKMYWINAHAIMS